NNSETSHIGLGSMITDTRPRIEPKSVRVMEVAVAGQPYHHDHEKGGARGVAARGRGGPPQRRGGGPRPRRRGGGGVGRGPAGAGAGWRGASAASEGLPPQRVPTASARVSSSTASSGATFGSRRSRQVITAWIRRTVASADDSPARRLTSLSWPALARSTPAPTWTASTSR